MREDIVGLGPKICAAKKTVAETMNRPIKFRLQFGLRWLLLLILLVACGFAWWRFRADRLANRTANRARAIQLLKSAPDPLGWDYDPAALVRAVNQLHSMGRDETLAALEEFDAQHPYGSYSSPHQSLELVVPLLFDRRNPEDKLPLPVDWFDDSKGYALTEEKWEIWIEVEDGVPFHTVVIGGTSGQPGDQSYLIDWARDHARLRTTPLAPGDIVQAAEAFMQRNKEKEGDESAGLWTDQHIRMQVYRSVEHLLDLSGDDDDSLAPYDDERWEKLKAACRDLDIYWDEKMQMFQAKSRR